MDTEFSEFANALLALRMGKPSNPLGYTTDDQGDNDTIGSEDDRMYKHRGLASSIMAVPSSSWAAHDFAASYDFMDHPQKQSRKRVHHVTVSATSSESNDAYDMDHMRGINLDKKISPKSGAGADKKLARGRYRCSLCGAFKTNHVCALVTDKLMCSVGTQSYNSTSTLSLVPQAAPQKEEAQGPSSASTGAAFEPLSPGASRSSAPMDYMLTVTSASGSAGNKANPFVPSGTAAAAAAAAVVASTDVTGSFQERIVTVSRNRKSIQNPIPVPEEEVTVLMTNSDGGSQDGGGGGGGGMLKLRKPSVASVSEEQVMTSSAASSPSRAVTPNSPYALAHKLDTMGTMALAAQAHALALHQAQVQARAHLTGLHRSHLRPLLSAPMQPMGMGMANMSTLHSYQQQGLSLSAGVKAAAPAPTPMSVQAPAPVPAKSVPNLIYPSALDLLGHAIYE